MKNIQFKTDCSVQSFEQNVRTSLRDDGDRLLFYVTMRLGGALTHKRSRWHCQTVYAGAWKKRERIKALFFKIRPIAKKCAHLTSHGISKRRARDSNSQPVSRHHISSVAASHSLTLQTT